ncbi:MAG: serine/threonine protein kinase [Planctomycetaceae bacterium]|nr:serine/threonine protein kinase [Planctomycetaceae bacterium]
MNHRSSIDTGSTAASPEDVPLAERPLLADDQKTVVSTTVQSATDDDVEVEVRSQPALSAQEIRDRLFRRSGSDSLSERGLRLGHFLVREQVGSGGMGAVFLADDLELSRQVALKVLNPVTSADPALVARFRNEARACAQLNHDNIARVYYSGQESGVHFIAYEYAAGQNIRQLITANGRLPEDDTLNYAIQATLALSHIDAAGVVHRDIKPSNIILTETGRIKVVDLGLARRDSQDSFGDLTVAGTMLGTFDYVAPEQARDPREADIRSDLYSLGCTVYHMLTGQPPYPEGTGMQKLLDHQGKSPPDPRSVALDISPEFSAIVQKMMNTDPALRYQDPGQLLVDLTSLATRVGLRTVPAEGIIWRRVPVRRVRELSGAIFLTGAVLAICVAALTMHFFPGRNVALEDAQFERWKAAADTPLSPRPTPEPKTEPLREPETAPTDTDRQDPPVTVPQPVPARPEIRLVAPDGTSEPMPSLQQALEGVKSGGEIVLDFDGPLPAPIPCLARLRSGDERVITIRAAEGRRPVLEFQGDESDGSGSPTPGRLLSMSSDLKLSFVGIHLKVSVRGDVQTDEWMLFELIGPGQLEIRDCVIDVLNPMRGQKASVVKLTEPRTEVSDAARTKIQFTNVVVRGGCDLITCAAQTSGDISIQQSAFALDGTLLRNLGSSYPFGVGGRLLCVMDHVTCLSTEPAFVLEASELLNEAEDFDRLIPALEVTSRSCVFDSLVSAGVLVASQGNTYVSELEDLFIWRGDHNLYHAVDTFWRVNSGKEAPRMYTFADWVSRWTPMSDASETSPQQALADVWFDADSRVALTSADLTTIGLGAFQLNRSLFFPADTATYRIDAASQLPGVDPSLLPSLELSSEIRP